MKDDLGNWIRIVDTPSDQKKDEPSKSLIESTVFSQMKKITGV